MHPLLRRQLERCGIPRDATEVGPEAWAQFLERVDRVYTEADEDRYLVERSMAISSQEMVELTESLSQSEASLSKERDRLEAMIACLGDGLCMFDGNGQVVLLNPEGERLLGWTQAELAGEQLLADLRFVQAHRTVLVEVGVAPGAAQIAAGQAQEQAGASGVVALALDRRSEYLLDQVVSHGVLRCRWSCRLLV